MEAWTFDSQGPEETLEAGRELGRSIGAEGLAIALVGPLGAGKTVFVKGLAEGLGVDPRVVSSPTFVIAQQYVVPEGPEVLHHVDLYRLESEDELESIGFYDMLGPGAVLAVEWADRFPGVLGREWLAIELEGPSPERSGERTTGQSEEPPTENDPPKRNRGPARRVAASASGGAAEQVLADWSARHQRARALAEAQEPRQGTGSFIEMRLGLTFVLALVLWGASQLELAPTEWPRCAALVPVGSDGLGTSHVVCAASDAERSRELEGLARLLVGERIDLNRADASLLEALPGIGPKRALAITRARSERPFGSLADLERVRGIGPRTRARLERWLRVEGRGEIGGTHDG